MQKLSSESRIGAVATKPSLVARDPSHDKNEPRESSYESWLQGPKKADATS
ncbi:MAG: hypothetical protein ABSB11_02365 [Sedimentisphaerales bacterium]